MSGSRPRVRLPVLPTSGAADPRADAADEEDPLALIRGGRFARVFAVILGVLGLVWIVSAQASARSGPDAVLLVHSSLQSALVVTPPMPEVE
ncbi:MAG: hypothetical protein KC468_06250, partial [Myxococcales bacterium]|nr:hypothetical protein [Myxococcales bacterium]